MWKSTATREIWVTEYSILTYPFGHLLRVTIPFTIGKPGHYLYYKQNGSNQTCTGLPGYRG